MGDMADYYLGLAGDECYDDYGEPCGYDGLWFPKKKYQLRCRTCGATNVYWHQYPSGKWFLFTQGSRTAHKCKEE